MSKSGVPFEKIKNNLMQDDAFKEEYERLQPRYELISQIIESRKEQKMAQSDLAKKVGTQKSNILYVLAFTHNFGLDMPSLGK